MSRNQMNNGGQYRYSPATAELLAFSGWAFVNLLAMLKFIRNSNDNSGHDAYLAGSSRDAFRYQG